MESSQPQSYHSSPLVGYTSTALQSVSDNRMQKNVFFLIPTVCGDRYRDGFEIQRSENITLQAEGTMRRLIIRSADTSDAGIYTCQTGNNSIEFSVNIRGTAF